MPRQKFPAWMGSRTLVENDWSYRIQLIWTRRNETGALVDSCRFLAGFFPSPAEQCGNYVRQSAQAPPRTGWRMRRFTHPASDESRGRVKPVGEVLWREHDLGHRKAEWPCGSGRMRERGVRHQWHDQPGAGFRYGIRPRPPPIFRPANPRPAFPTRSIKAQASPTGPGPTRIACGAPPFGSIPRI